ncbi:hypothetical protein CBOM_05704 [Ceraceosorus bombacis]|uniref:Zinc-ribbon 15 domain-containing protein n=2 Tax=Ceraceosorus TaxID=401624 RepID=A0A0N7LBC7_9BASI|nr:hypothetical protein IE81DRAFT_324350 [Ceraceosorus guamensis]PWN41604.1 hypothetical protein IE81DRAFT_324350 [Ceraceosorus guamensis]CEH19018.1 hypothetical protein CBOM_05704 [Ceraceosorus bombacis]
MDFFFCIPVIFGCPSKIKQEGDGTPHICPRCHNAQAVTAKKKRWFELCWIPLIPLGSKHVYYCGICQWQMPQDGGFKPQVAGGNYQHPGYGPPTGYGPPQGYPPK